MITRSKMRRQLYRGGGIADLYPRQKFGVGSWFQDKKDKAINVFRKVVPNELADIAVKAAPFVAPFNPLAAGMMRGLGRLDQRGNLTDALKQGIGTYAGGKIAQTYSPFRETPIERQKTEGPGGWFEDVREKTRKLMLGEKTPGKVDELMKATRAKATQYPERASAIWDRAEAAIEAAEKGSKGFLGRGGEFAIRDAIGGGMPAVYAASTGLSLAIGKALEKVGPKQPDETDAEWKARRKAAVAPILRENYMTLNRWRSPSDAEVDRFVEQYTREYNQGGRVGLYGGGEPEAGIKSLDAGAPNITYEGNEGPKAPMKMASVDNPFYRSGDEDEHSFRMFGKPYKELNADELEEFREEMMRLMNKFSKGPVLPSPEDPINPWAPKPTGPVLPDKMMAAKGGRIKYRMGTGPAGLPGIPRMAPDGMEFDMRQNGGFQGLGAKEGKDDVPAMLAKNEFVFTADAVRGAGGGDIELGAQRMYDTMKNLEKRVV